MRADRPLTVVAALVGLALLALAAPAVAGETGTALVYRGPGACAGCPEAAAAIARDAGLGVAFIGPAEVTPGRLRGAAVYVQGGGEDSLILRAALGPEGMAAIADYVRAGGRYWGLCAGAYLAGDSLDDAGIVPGLRLFAGDAVPYSPQAARVETVIWQGAPQPLYLQEAPAFDLAPEAGATIIARYAGGAVAAFQAPAGRGWIALSGPHPEATPDWLADDGLPDQPLAPPVLATLMLQALLAAGRPVAPSDDDEIGR